MRLGGSNWSDARLDAMQQEMRAGFARVDGDLRDINGRIDSLQRAMLQIGGGIIAALIGLIGVVLGQALA